MASFPSVDLTNFDLAPFVQTLRKTGGSVASTTAGLARDSAYTTVGLGLLTYQRIQVRRREIERELRG
ncbi:MAG: hypothetical protein ACJAR2_000224 [Ilumatobacter sp.]|jgi:hypothetical protein